MQYELNVDGMTELSEMLSQLEEAAPGVAAMGLYDGAGAMADEISRAADSIKTAPFRYARGGHRRLPSPEEKEIVQAASAGIAKFDKNGTEVNTSVGFRNAGYAKLKGKTKPIPQIVNAIISGTSFMSKQPFIRQASAKGRGKAMAAIKATIEEAFDKIIK